jgi:Chaperone of endosialidase
MTRLRSILLAALLLGPVGSLAAQNDTTFTYQGQLKLAGEVLNDTADFEFTLWDANAAGSMIGSVQSANNVTVVDGLFTVQLDFGVFAPNGEDRWLAIDVRSPAGGGAFTTLNPRQPITRAPFSIQTRGINVDNNGFVGVGRSGRVTVNEVFGVHRPGTAFGGIYTSTDAGGKPFYGYSDGAQIAYHYLEGTSGDWKLYVDGVRMTVTDEGNVGIGTQSPSWPLDIVSNTTRAMRATTSSAIGIEGRSTGPGGTGMLGVSTSTTQGVATEGVTGRVHGPAGRGVLGEAVASSGAGVGVYGKSNSSAGFDVFAGGAGINYGSSSSRRWKKNVEPISDALHKLAQLRGVYFDWDSEHGGRHDVGMIAEEVGAVLPEIVGYEENGVDAIGLDYSKMTPLLVEAVNALRVENQTLRSVNERQSDEIVDLTARMAQLEAMMSQKAERGAK